MHVHIMGICGTFMGGIRAAGYAGTVVVTTYYSPDYNDPVITGFAKAVNMALVMVPLMVLYGLSIVLTSVGVRLNRAEET